jgi:hypothetical protein
VSFKESDVVAASRTTDKGQTSERGEVGAVPVAFGLQANRVAKESHIRDDMIRVAHRAGGSIRQLAEVDGLRRKQSRTLSPTTVKHDVDSSQ